MICDVIVVVWNEPDTTKACLDRIITYTSAPYRLIIIDNNSEAETKQYLESFAANHQNAVNLIRNEENSGYLKAANQGLRASSAEYKCLLNNDTLVTDGWLGELIAVADKNPDVGLLNPSSNTLGQKTDVKNIDKLAGALKEHAGEYEEMAQASGFCMLIKKELSDKIGLLDEAYGIGYFEDTDYSRRAREAGYRIARAKASYVYHLENVSFLRLKQPNRHFEASRRIFEKKWGRPKRIFIALNRDLTDSEQACLRRLAGKGNWINVMLPRGNASADFNHTNIKIRQGPGGMFVLGSLFLVLKKTKKRYNVLVTNSGIINKFYSCFKFIHKARVLNIKELEHIDEQR